MLDWLKAKIGKWTFVSFGSRLFGVLGLALAPFGAYHAIMGHATQATLLLTTALLFFFVGTLDRFEEIAGLGLKAKLRTKLEEADDLLAMLRAQAEVNGSTLLRLTALSGRMNSAATAEVRHQLASEIRAMLTKSGASIDPVRPSLELIAKTLAHDLANKLLRHLDLHYRGAANGLSQALHGAQYADDGDLHDALTKRLKKHEAEYKQLEGRGSWTLLDYAATLRQGLVGMSEIAPDVIAPYLREVDSWAPELDHLAVTLELRTPERWINFLDRQP